MKPLSRTPNTQKALGRMTRDTSELPPKRRRQLTEKPAGPTGTPFSQLGALTARALK